MIMNKKTMLKHSRLYINVSLLLFFSGGVLFPLPYHPVDMPLNMKMTINLSQYFAKHFFIVILVL